MLAVGIVALSLGLLLVGVFLWISRLKSQAETELRAHAQHWLHVEPSANLIGLGSAGGKQLRGNGALGVSEDSLWFVQWVPRRTLHIPRARITSVDQTRAHAGKAGPLMLRVAFDEEGRSDTIAWVVREPDTLQRILSA